MCSSDLSYNYWVVVETTNNVTSIDRVQYFRAITKNHGALSLVNLPEIGERFYGIRKRDYPDLQWDYIVYDFHDGTDDHPMSYSTFKQMQIDFGNQEILEEIEEPRFPIRTINFWQNPEVEFPYAELYFDDLYIYGGDGIQSYNGIVYLRANSIKIFSKVPADVKFAANVSGVSKRSSTRYLYVQNPTGFTTADRMFSGLGSCSVNIEDFDFSNINDVIEMFNSAYFEGVNSYPFFDTSHVKDMSYMFGNSLDAIGLLNNIPLYDTSNVTKMYGMFSGRIIDVILPNFNTSKVTDMMFMFEDSTINSTLPNWDTSNVTDMGHLFAKSNIKVFPNWNISKVTSTYYMFYNCKELTEFRMDMSLVTNADNMFKGCTSLSDLYISNLKASTDISDCPLTDDAAHFIFFNLQIVTDKTLTVSKNLKHVDIYADLATRKGWTVTLV